MKKVLIIVLVCALFASCASAETSRYVDPETGVSFDIPDGWVEFPNTSGNESIKVLYTPKGKEGIISIGFSVIDLYTVTNMANYGYSRKEIDDTYLDDELVAMLMGSAEYKSNEEKKYGDYQYRIIDASLSMEKAGLTFNIDNVMAMTLVNGYVLMFVYSDMGNSDGYHAAFEDVLTSTQIE